MPDPDDSALVEGLARVIEPHAFEADADTDAGLYALLEPFRSRGIRRAAAVLAYLREQGLLVEPPK